MGDEPEQKVPADKPIACGEDINETRAESLPEVEPVRTEAETPGVAARKNSPEEDDDPYADVEDLRPEVELSDAQDNFVETREPAELVMCVVLAAAYVGLARFCGELMSTKYWPVVGFFITIGLLSLLLGCRPYISPSALQLSRHGVKYRGPYWPQRKTVNWTEVERMYVSPELIFILYHLPDKPRKMRLLLIHSVYLADKEKILESLRRFCPLAPTLLANPGIFTRIMQYGFFLLLVGWILHLLMI